MKSNFNPCRRIGTVFYNYLKTGGQVCDAVFLRFTEKKRIGNILHSTFETRIKCKNYLPIIKLLIQGILNAQLRKRSACTEF